MKCSDQVVKDSLSSPGTSPPYQVEIPSLKGEGTKFKEIKEMAKFSAAGDIKNLPSEVEKHVHKTIAPSTYSRDLTKISGRDVQSDFRAQAQGKNKDSLYSGHDNAISLVQSETRSTSNVRDGNGDSSCSPVKSHDFGEKYTFQSKVDAGKSGTLNRKVDEGNAGSLTKTLAPYDSFAHRSILEWNDFFGQTSEQKCPWHNGYNRSGGQNSTAERDANINDESGDISYPAIKSCASKLRENTRMTGGTLNKNVLQQKTVKKGKKIENGGSVLEMFPTNQKKPNVVIPRGITKMENGSSSSYCENNPLKKAPDCIDVYSQQFNKKQVKSNFPSESRNQSDHTRPNSLYTSTTSGKPPGNPKTPFRVALNRWLSVRNASIEKLLKLLDNVMKNEAFYDTIQLNCKYGSVNCKQAKCVAPDSTWTWELAASVGSMFCDMAGGLTSVAHMFSTNGIQFEFQQIMDTDADATKEMYDARSKYVAEYNYTDEIIRKFGGTTLGETLGKISEAVGITDFFQKMKKANDNREDIVLAAVSALCGIMDRNCNRDVGREVIDAVQELVDSNPACVGTVAGIGKSLYGAADLRLLPLKRAGKVGALVKAGTLTVDTILVKQEQAEIQELERKMVFRSESTVEGNIRRALVMFRDEKNEMLKLLSEL